VFSASLGPRIGKRPASDYGGAVRFITDTLGWGQILNRWVGYEMAALFTDESRPSNRAVIFRSKQWPPPDCPNLSRIFKPLQLARQAGFDSGRANRQDIGANPHASASYGSRTCERRSNRSVVAPQARAAPSWRANRSCGYGKPKRVGAWRHFPVFDFLGYHAQRQRLRL
jgi:hypothetical protein